MSSPILVVDDELDIQTLMELILAEKGYQTVKCMNGDDAIRMLSENKYGLILLDLNLPGTGGRDIADFVDANCKTPIVFITGAENAETLALQHECMDRKDRHFMYKPIMTDELYRSVEVLIRD